MQISCTICQELLLPSQVCLIIQCGHIHHEQCLLRWLAQSKSCPQCRASTRFQPFKVYFNVNDSGGDDSNETLAARLEQVENESQELRQSNRELKYELERVLQKSNNYEEKLDTANKELQTFKCAVESLKMKISVLATLSREKEELSKKYAEAKLTIESLNKLKLVLDGSKEEVSRMLLNYGPNVDSVRQLCTHVEFLKQNSEKYKDRCNKLLMKQHPLTKELSDLKREKERLLDHINSLEAKNHSVANISDDADEENSLLPNIDVKDDSLIVISEKILNDCGKKINIVSAKANERLKHKSAVSRGPRPNPFAPRKNNGPHASDSQNYVYDGMGGCKRLSSIVAPTTMEDKLLSAARAAKTSKGVAPKVRPTLVNPSSQPSIRGFMAASSSTEGLTSKRDKCMKLIENNQHILNKLKLRMEAAPPTSSLQRASRSETSQDMTYIDLD